jgi:hypothetical protein
MAAGSTGSEDSFMFDEEIEEEVEEDNIYLDQLERTEDGDDGTNK